MEARYSEFSVNKSKKSENDSDNIYDKNNKFTYDILFTDKILISNGTYSNVYKVKNIKTNEHLAAKVYNTKFSEEFFLEMFILNKCEHPNILKLKYV